VTRPSIAVSVTFVLAAALFAAPPLHAQPAAATTAGPSEDDDSRLRPLEPDFTVVNLPTTLPLPAGGSNFHLTHRFNENLRRDDFGTQASNLFGLDQGANIQLEYRFGIAKHLEAIAARTNVDRTIQFSAKYDAFHEGAGHPFGASAIVAVEGGNNFRVRYAQTVGASVSRTVGTVAALYVDPIWVHNSLPDALDTQTTFYVGIGARIRILPSTFIVGEVSPRAAGYKPGDAEYAFAIEKRVGAHVFSLTFANGQGTTFGQLARGGNPEALYLGFNLARKFY
jgi:hypothetical protein